MPVSVGSPLQFIAREIANLLLGAWQVTQGHANARGSAATNASGDGNRSANASSNQSGSAGVNFPTQLAPPPASPPEAALARRLCPLAGLLFWPARPLERCLECHITCRPLMTALGRERTFARHTH